MEQQYRRGDFEFISSGTKCAAWLYTPVNASSLPLVIMGHGFAAERGFGLPKYAERFVQQGWAVMIFDYRTFGASDGLPRNNVNPFDHSEDWDAAIMAARELPDIDPSRIVLWGTSFGGGHVTLAATRHADVAGIIAQVPYAGLPEDAPRPPRMLQLRLAMHILYDRLKTFLTGKPHYIPVIGRPGELAVMSTEESYDGYMALIPEGTEFLNQVPAKIFTMMGAYNPTAGAHLVACPALVIAAEQDSLVEIGLVKAMAERMPQAEFRSLDCNHFAPYIGDMFEQNIKLQLEFLARL